MPTTAEEIMRKEAMPKGSTIWELASQNRDIINRHAFWEIINGRTTKFWEEAWQHRGRMVEIQEIQNTYRAAKAKGLNYVNDYWKEGRENEMWREWIGPEEWDNNIDEELKARIIKEMDSRRIKNRDGPDILRWGETTKCTFTVKEAYIIKAKKAQEDRTQEWNQLWKNRWWPKVTIFS